MRLSGPAGATSLSLAWRAVGLRRYSEHATWRRAFQRRPSIPRIASLPRGAGCPSAVSDGLLGERQRAERMGRVRLPDALAREPTPVFRSN